MRDEGWLMIRLDRLLQGVSEEIKRRVLRRAYQEHVGRLTGAERMRLHRNEMSQKRHPNVTKTSPKSDETVTPSPRSPLLSHAKKQSPTYSEGFSKFWSFYPKRVGKGEAFKAWTRGNCEVLSEVVVQAVREQNGYLIREGGQYTPLPATWLNQRRWEDEPPESSPLSDKTRGNVEAIRQAVATIKGEGTVP